MSLMELIIVLGILTVLITYCTYNYFNIYNSCINSNNVDFCNNYILHSLKNSAVYCREKNKSGYIIFKEDSIMDFYCNNKKIKRYKIPEGFKFLNEDGFGRMIFINNLGTISTSCTVAYKDTKGKNHNITIRVGTHYVQIK